ncbi:MAG: molecular chaperone Hsp90 [Eubacterium sp.]
MTKDEIKEEVKKAIEAPSCCEELKEVGKEYLDAVGTPDEDKAAKNLIAELEDDVTSIDDLIALAGSAAGEKIFGKEKAEGLLKAAKEAKAQGEKFCICPACQAGGKVLVHKEDLL